MLSFSKLSFPETAVLTQSYLVLETSHRVLENYFTVIIQNSLENLNVNHGFRNLCFEKVNVKHGKRQAEHGRTVAKACRCVALLCFCWSEMLITRGKQLSLPLDS